MANGDAAAAAGLATFAPAQDHGMGYDNDNIRGDELAGHIIDGGHPWGKISGKPALYNQAQTNALIDDGVDRAVDFSREYTDQRFEIAEQPTSSLRADGPSSAAYTRTSGAGLVSVYMNNAFQFCRSTSSRRYKEDIVDAELDPAAVLSLRPVTFHRKGEPLETREFGLIAEEVADAGLEELVVHYDGQIDGVRYDMVAVALIAALKDQQAQLEQLRETVAALTAGPTTEGA